MRAALLPTPGDPFMLAYWLRNYETWRDQVDELVVFVNGQTDPEAVAYDRKIVEAAGGRMVYSADSAGHDGALRVLLTSTTASHVVLCEDDAYVRKPDEVGWAFLDIITGRTDIVGSPRHEDYAGQFVEFGDYVPGDLDELRHGLWPAFLFARRSDLLATDQRFGDQAWPIGETIPGWGRVTPKACEFVGISDLHLHLDTLFATTFQLRAAGLRTRLVHHVRLFDAKATEEWLAEDPPWFHVTGLSTLSDALSGRELPDMDERGGLWTRRLAWWLRTMDAFDTNETMMRINRYRALESFIGRAHIDLASMDGWEVRFDQWDPMRVPA